MSCSSVPAPISVVLTSNKPNPIRSNVTLTCTVQVSQALICQAIICQATVNILWTGPNGFMRRNVIQHNFMGGNTSYTGTIMITSFTTENSGNYTCIANISTDDNNGAVTSNGILITTGKKACNCNPQV